MIKAVVVDFDDTLCLTRDASFVLENEVLRRMGRAPVDAAVHRATWGAALPEAIGTRSPGIDAAAFLTHFRAAMREHVAAGRLDVVAPENLRALDELLLAGYAVHILTSRSEEEVAHLLDPGHALAARVGRIYHLGNTSHRKPDPRAFDALLADCGLRPAECVYAGDSPGDALAAGRAGLRFVACLQSGLRTPSDFDARYVDAYLDAFPGIVAAVRRLDGHPAGG